MVIIGVDPGTCVTGYGVIKSNGHSKNPISYGCIKPPSALSLSERYHIIFNDMEILLEEFSPDALSVETQFVSKNVQSAIKLGMARGVIVLAATRRGIPVYEYSPSQAKKAVVGKGRASKGQVQMMVQAILRLSSLPEPEDAADALALALCHAHASDFQKSVGSRL